MSANLKRVVSKWVFWASSRYSGAIIPLVHKKGGSEFVYLHVSKFPDV